MKTKHPVSMSKYSKQFLRKFKILFSGKILWHRLRFITMNICHIEDEIARLRKSYMEFQKCIYYMVFETHSINHPKEKTYNMLLFAGIYLKSKARKASIWTLYNHVIPSKLKNILFNLYDGCIICIFKNFL